MLKLVVQAISDTEDGDVDVEWYWDDDGLTIGLGHEDDRPHLWFSADQWRRFLQLLDLLRNATPE